MGLVPYISPPCHDFSPRIEDTGNPGLSEIHLSLHNLIMSMIWATGVSSDFRFLNTDPESLNVRFTKHIPTYIVTSN